MFILFLLVLDHLVTACLSCSVIFFQKEKVDKTGRFLFPKRDRPYGRPNFSWVLIFIYAAAIIFIFHPILFHFYAVTINRSKLKGIH